MAYSSNPNLPKARATALRLLIADGVPSAVVANKCGVHRSTIWRWKQKWLKLNENVEQSKPGRPTRKTGFVAQYYRWIIRTESSAPQSSPQAIGKAIIERVLALRAQLKRCAEVIWHHLRWIDGIRISLSSVHRILRRHHEYASARKNRVRPDNPRRPMVARPGELVQTDTIHYACPISRRRRYVYTVLDLYSRMAYAEIHDYIRPGIAADVTIRAQKAMGVRFTMVQAGSGPEFGRYFAQRLGKDTIAVRHSRLGRPNDNAHIERFNRTIQEECLGHYLDPRTKTETIQKKINEYIDYYNNKRVHLGLQLRIPIQMLQRS